MNIFKIWKKKSKNCRLVDLVFFYSNAQYICVVLCVLYHMNAQKRLESTKLATITMQFFKKYFQYNLSIVVGLLYVKSMELKKGPKITIWPKHNTKTDRMRESWRETKKHQKSSYSSILCLCIDWHRRTLHRNQNMHIPAFCNWRCMFTLFVNNVVRLLFSVYTLYVCTIDIKSIHQ